MISCIIVFDCRVTRVVYDDADQWLFASCVKLVIRILRETLAMLAT